MEDKGEQTEAQREFWQTFYEENSHLDTPKGREVVDWVLQKKLPDIHLLPIEDASKVLAETADNILKEQEPPPSLGSIINERAQERRAATPIKGANRQ